ncbi:hypothetical protein ACFLXG_03940 [Chloroflexota bacterium]
MIKALKVTMIIWGVIGILFGLAYIFTPTQIGEMFGYEKGPAHGYAMLALLGGSFIAVSVFVIMAARDPLRNISWVKFVILYSLVNLVLEIYSVIRGYVDFTQAGVGIILWAIFAAAFLGFYPWRAASRAA